MSKLANIIDWYTDEGADTIPTNPTYQWATTLACDTCATVKETAVIFDGFIDQTVRTCAECFEGEQQ